MKPDLVPPASRAEPGKECVTPGLRPGLFSSARRAGSLIIPIYQTLSSTRTFFQESRVEGLRQKLADVDNLTLAFQVCQSYFGVLGVLPDDLPAGAARRSQLLR